MAAIPPISGPAFPEPIRPAAESPAGEGFREAFAAAVQSVERSSHQAAAAVDRFLSGEGEDVHTTILAAQRAELAFEFFLQARNKVISAYQEIMRMQM